MTAENNIAHGLVFLMILIVSGIAGCGYKTMPVPPEEIVPKAIVDLGYELDERGVTLTWTYPEETVRGDSLPEITSFKLYRAVVPADQYCDNCPIPFIEPLLIEGGVVVAGKPKVGVYSTTLLRPGHLYFFKVRSGSGWWAESADSNVVSFLWDIPAGAPQTLDATAGDRRVMLRWSPVTTHIDGTPIKEPVRYQVLRSSSGGLFSPAGALQEGLEYVDGEVANGMKYQYKVQAVTMYEKGQVGGGVSPVVDAVPVDQTPPPVPRSVQGVRTAGSVKVIWEQVEAVDLKGYRIYRRLPGETRPVQVGEVEVPSTMFEDTSLPEAEEWLYSVSSFDRAVPANESKPSAEIEVRN